MTGPLWTRLPNGWLTGQVKNFATVTLGKMLQSKDGGSDVRAPYMRAANVQPDGALALDDMNEMWFSEAELEHLSIRAGDVVVVEGGQGGFGRAAYVENDLPGWGFQNSINRLRPIGDLDGRFVAFYLIALRASGYIRAYSNVVSMPHLTAEKLARVPIPLPQVEEQRLIANYLDRETARIDTLIDEQQRLIEMLRERRLAVITESVVGASTTSRRSGDSAWYPSLPVGWGRGRVKSIAIRVTDGAHISPDTDGGIFDFVSTRDLNGGSIDFAGALKTTPETYEYMVKTGCQPYDGDVLFSKDGTVGETAVVRGGHLFVVASSLVIVSPDRERMVSNYLAYVFASKTAREQATSMMRGAGLPRLSVGNLARLEVPIPPLGEQRDIAAYLDKQTSKIDALIVESKRFIELARERRAALITAAVTGQIDVREAA